MCGRFSFSHLKKIIEERFDLEIEDEFTPRYNCAPSQTLAVITNENTRRFSFYRWGLIPFWAKDPSFGNKLINARAETIFEKPSYKQAILKRRCLIPTDGFFEWKKDKVARPYRFTMIDNSLFTMAGIWETWKNQSGIETRSFSIITTTANNLANSVHDRMPVILKPEDEKKWLGSLTKNAIEDILKPLDENKMKCFEVSSIVNSPLNDVPEVLLPV